MIGLIGINVLGGCSVIPVQDQRKDTTVSADAIVLWAAALGFAYVAGVSICFELASAKRGVPSSINYGFGRHTRPLRVKVRF